MAIRTAPLVTAALHPLLLRTYVDSIEQIPLLNDIFGHLPHPGTVAEWQSLPTTDKETYSKAPSMKAAFRGVDRLVSPEAPLDLSSPSFPLTVLQSCADKAAVTDRILHILNFLDWDGIADLVCVSDRITRYFAAELAELLLTLGLPCKLLMCDHMDSETCARLVGPRSQHVCWLHKQPLSRELLPPTVRGVITFNCMHSLSFLHHANVLHLDEAPFLAVSRGAQEYSYLPSHFHIDVSGDGLLVTTLKQDLLPLVRYRTGWFGHVNHDGQGLFVQEGT